MALAQPAPAAPHLKPLTDELVRSVPPECRHRAAVLVADALGCGVAPAADGIVLYARQMHRPLPALSAEGMAWARRIEERLGIPCLSQHEPWASLTAYGVKGVETRGWRPTRAHVGSLMGFASTAAWTPEGRALVPLAVERMRAAGLEATNYTWPLGRLLCTGYLAYWFPAEELEWADRLPGGRPWVIRKSLPVVAESQRALGDFGPGRYAWFLDRIERVIPSPAIKGRQGWWEWRREV